MNRKEYLEKNSCGLKEAYAKASLLEVGHCPVTEQLTVLIRRPRVMGLSSDGGDYYIWAHLTQVSPYIYKVVGDWSCDFAPLHEGYLGGDYIVLTAEDMEGMMCLPAENQEADEEEDFLISTLS